MQRGVRNRTWLLSRVAVTTGRMHATVEGDADVVNSEGVHCSSCLFRQLSPITLSLEVRVRGSACVALPSGTEDASGGRKAVLAVKNSLSARRVRTSSRHIISDYSLSLGYSLHRAIL